MNTASNQHSSHTDPKVDEPQMQVARENTPTTMRSKKQWHIKAIIALALLVSFGVGWFVTLALTTPKQATDIKTTTNSSLSSTQSHASDSPRAVNPANIPIGDGHVSLTTAAVGSVYECKTPRNKGGAEHSGAWIKGGYWDSTAKPTVDGSVSWENAMYSTSTQNNYRIIVGNGLPVNDILNSLC